MDIEHQAYQDSSRTRRIRGSHTVLLLALCVACSAPDSTAPLMNPAYFDLAAAAEIEKPVIEDEVKYADENGNGLVCAKGTPSGHVLYKDDNTSTPSQPCPPAFAVVGKGGAVKVPADFSADDENRNGVVCWKETKPGVYIAKDDNLNTPSQPCPPAYNLLGTSKKAKVESKDLAEADENRNTIVCLLVIDPTNHFIVKDDNLNTPSQPCPPSFSVESLGPTEAEPAEPPKK